jgi:hypothetical protein
MVARANRRNATASRSIANDASAAAVDALDTPATVDAFAASSSLADDGQHLDNFLLFGSSPLDSPDTNAIVGGTPNDVDVNDANDCDDTSVNVKGDDVDESEFLPNAAVNDDTMLVDAPSNDANEEGEDTNMEEDTSLYAQDETSAAVNNEKAKSLASLFNHFNQDMDILRTNNVIKEHFLQTCQGTTVGSANGCTVISLLLCSYFLDSTDNHCINDDGLIEKIINIDCIPILDDIRAMNNLDRLGLLAVYEVYPWLIEHGHFIDVQFDTAGGNVFDDNDMNSMYTSLVQGFTNNEYRKTSANLYFRGHNLCLCMYHGEGNAICLDFIDSMPNKIAWGHDHNNGMRGNRVTCTNVTMENFITLIRYYACSKLTIDDLISIDGVDFFGARDESDVRIIQLTILRGDATTTTVADNVDASYVVMTSDTPSLEPPAESWDLVKIYSTKDILMSNAVKCMGDNCCLVACSIWSSTLNPEEPWFSCLGKLLCTNMCFILLLHTIRDNISSIPSTPLTLTPTPTLL